MRGKAQRSPGTGQRKVQGSSGTGQRKALEGRDGHLPATKAPPDPQGQMSLHVPSRAGYRGGGRLGGAAARAHGRGLRSVSHTSPPVALCGLQASALMGGATSWLGDGHCDSITCEQYWRLLGLILNCVDVTHLCLQVGEGAGLAPSAASFSQSADRCKQRPRHLLSLSVVLCTVTLGTPGPASGGDEKPEKKQKKVC